MQIFIADARLDRSDVDDDVNDVVVDMSHITEQVGHDVRINNQIARIARVPGHSGCAFGARDGSDACGSMRWPACMLALRMHGCK